MAKLSNQDILDMISETRLERLDESDECVEPTAVLPSQEWLDHMYFSICALSDALEPEPKKPS
jgi:hypothetical protein